MTLAPEAPLSPASLESRRWGPPGWLGVALIGLLGIALVVWPEIGQGRLPGDVGDARFNLYVLEHGYLWLTGQVASFWDAPIFYPFPLATAFSDNHLGTGFIYWIFRAFGGRPEDAFRGWYLLGFVANFAACAYALRRLDHGWAASGFGAFLFAFAMPVTAQAPHAQLSYRFGVPLAVLALLRFDRMPRLSTALALGFWTVWQFYCSIYLGYFLCLLLGAFVVALAVRQRGWRALGHWPAQLGTAWRGESPLRRIGFLAGAAGLAASLAGLLLPYARVSRLYNFSRSWDEIASMLPRPASYLLTDWSLIWRFHWSAFEALPMRHEHQLFIGAAPFIAVALYLWLRRRHGVVQGPYFVSTALAAGLVVLATLWVHGSLYHAIALVPGADSIRAVSRIGLVLLFPAALLFAGALDALAALRGAWRPATACLVAICVLMIVECSAVDHYASPEAGWQARLAASAADLPADLPEHPILLVGPRGGEPNEVRELDGMALAQARGWPSLNGYSGNVPPGHVLTGGCEDAAVDLSVALDMLGRPGDEPYQALARRVVLVGYPDCDRSWTEHRPQLTRFAGPLPGGLMAQVAVSIEAVSVRNGVPVVAVSIANHGDMALPAISTTKTPVRLSARYFPAAGVTAETLRSPGWELRQDLGGDVPAGAVRRVDMSLPLPPQGGPYVIGVTLVQDGVAWFHNEGMAVAVSDRTISLDPGLQLGDRR